MSQDILIHCSIGAVAGFSAGYAIANAAAIRKASKRIHKLERQVYDLSTLGSFAAITDRIASKLASKSGETPLVRDHRRGELR